MKDKEMMLNWIKAAATVGRSFRARRARKSIVDPPDPPPRPRPPAGSRTTRRAPSWRQTRS